MALSIPIKALPNQSLNVVLSDQNCSINLLSRNNNVYMDLFLNNINIIYGRKLSLTSVLPYLYMKSEFIGNFTIINNDGNIIVNPDYRLFGISQSLIYYTDEDVNGTNT